jgi:hypothetical protein
MVYGELKQGYIYGTWRIKTRIHMVQGILKQGCMGYMEN